MSSSPHPCETMLARLPDRLLIAVSGGMDSVALLEALVRAGRDPIILHVDHGWRTESAGEAKAVRALAKNYDLPIAATKLRPNKKSENSARVARYAFFTRMAKKFQRCDLVVAHHADDQVETFLLQLLRGAGSGAGGMDERRARGGLILHRPWLGLWKKEILAYALDRKLKWSEDKTNADTLHRRNLIRRRLVPYLTKLAGPEAARHLWRAAEIARAESEWMDTLCAEVAAKLTLPAAVLRAMPIGQQRRTILRWLQSRGVADISFTNVEAVRGLLTERSPAKINLSRSQFARRRAGIIFLA